MKRIRCFALFLTMLVACMFMPTNVQAEEATDVAQEVLEARTGVLRINVGAKVTGNTDATLIQVGSGFLIGTEDGDQRVITNYHVVDAANSINEFAKDTNTPVKNIKRVIQVVIASNDVSVDAELEQSSEANDIAILKLKKNIYNSKCFSLSSKANLQETQTVYALGYPYEQTTYGQDFSKLKNEDVTIEKGAVSKFTTKGGTNVIVNSAQISRGNSGGPLVDSQGNVVGVNSYTLGTSDGGNYYYAIEIDTVREMLDALGIQYTSADGSTQGANVQEGTDTDPSGNKLVLNKATYGSFDEKKALYQSPVTTVDKTTPVIEARTITGHQKATAYNKDKKTGRQYYSDDAVSIEIKVTEENFKNALFGNTIAGLGEEKATSTGFKITYSKDDRISDAIENIICSDTTDASLTEDSTKDYKWNPKGWKSDYVGGKRVWTNTVTFYTEKNYNISYDCTDLAVRKADSESDKITIDRTKPEINLVTIDTNGHKNDAEGTLNSDFVFRKGSEHASLLDFYDYVTFGYFTKGKIAVVIEAHDDVSGIQYVDVDIDGESSERHLISDTAKGNGMTHKSGNTWGTIIIKDADYKGKIKAKPTDMSGNTASKYTEPRGVISETQSQHNKAKTMKITTLTKPSNTANGINYYNRSVAVNISMGDSHSGLKSWGYTAGTAVKDNKNYGEAAGTTDKNGNPTVNNVYSMNKTVTMAAGDTNYTNKDNPTMVETEFEDNAGWTEKANEKYVIDDKKPIIKVDWTSSANVMNEKYYKATRVAHITVTERNFNEAGVDWQINNETGVVKSGWSHNGDTHTCDVSFTKDGDFILNFKITDYAMNSDSYKGEEFTIDKTAPVISISFDRNNPSNGYYFNTPRTATLHIEEHNFAAKDVTYELSGSNDGKGIGSPTAGGWSTGSDHHTASIYYGSDGEFSLNFNYTDMAGNPANKIQTEKFVIDLTKPVCKITNVEDHAAYNGKVAPGIEYSDTNLDENQVTVKLVGNKVGNASYEKNAPVSIHNGRTVQWKDFARKEKVDDIYTMELTIKDKAGNESTDKKVFSVNRFGSNYIFGTDTQALLDKIYSNQEIPVEVREINVNSLKEKAISVKNEDNEITELQAGSDYTVTEGNDKYKWKEYRYVINGDVFAQESEYNVTLSSKDAAANEMNNVAKNKDIDFIIDKTNPTGIVSGLEESSYKEDSHKINVRAMDNYQLDEAVLYVDGSEYKTFASEDFQGDKGVEVTLDSKNKPQEIYLSLTDKAGNSVDLKKTQCLITSNAWIQYINNKPLFYSTVGGGAALIIAILGIATRGFGYASSMAAQSGFWWTILGKRREDEDED